MSSEASVYEGLWTNWDHGRVLGARLTLSSLKATVLIAFIAVFVARCGDQLWVIVGFVLHRRLAAKGNGDPKTLFILRNCSSLETVLRCFESILRQNSVDYNQNINPRRRSLVGLSILAILIAGFLSIGGIVAAALSSDVTHVDDHLLIHSPNCGLYYLTNLSSIYPLGPGQAERQLSARRATEYVQTCYNNTKSSNNLCQRFVQQQITSEIERNVSCPFAIGMCLGGDAGAFEITSGLINSHIDLGLNAPPHNRVLYGRKTICAPLVTEGYTSLVPGQFEGEQFALYHYGSITRDDWTYVTSTFANKTQAGYVLRYSLITPDGRFCS